MTTRKIPKGWHIHKNGGGLVQDTASVEESARVSGNARVFGDAWVFGDAQVSGDAWEKSPLYIQGSKHSLTNAKYGHIQIGCHCHPIAYWREHYKGIGKLEGYSDAEIQEYGLLIELFAKIGK